MAAHLNEVIKALQQGKLLILVQEDQTQDRIQEYLAELTRSDPGADDESPSRPVLAWDPVDGFIPCDAKFPDALPERSDLIEALEFIRDYSGRALFVLDCREVDPTEGADRLRKALKQAQTRLLGRKNAGVVLVWSAPVPAEVAKQQVWIGETPVAPARAAAVSGGEYRDLRDLARFDTPTWEERLERMQPEEVGEIAKSGAHRESLDRLDELRRVLKGRFARKAELIDALTVAAIAQIPTVLIGPPGTAKSNMIRCFCEGLGLSGLRSETDGNGSGGGRKYFEYLLTRYTTPEEIFGPIHVQDLIDKQIYRRVTTGYLPTVQIAFLDEIFKASSAILNTLLTLLNERIFYNAGVAVRVPLLMVFAAANKAPTDESLQALYDRFPLRLNCPSVEPEHIGSLLKASWAQAFDRQFSAAGVAVPQCACTNDLRLLRHVMRVQFGGRNVEPQVKGEFDFTEEFLRFFQSLRSDFAISDRTAAALYAFCRANAMLRRSELMLDDLDVFRYVIWDETGTGDLDRLVTNMKRGVRL